MGVRRALRYDPVPCKQQAEDYAERPIDASSRSPRKHSPLPTSRLRTSVELFSHLSTALRIGQIAHAQPLHPARVNYRVSQRFALTGCSFARENMGKREERPRVAKTTSSPPGEGVRQKEMNMERTLSRRDFLVGAAAAGAALGIAGCTPQGGDVVAKTEDVD